MNISAERLENCQAVVTIAFEPPEIEKTMRAKARQISRHRQIPGFRPGRAPYPIIERFVGREVLLQYAIDELTPEALTTALEDNDLHVYDTDTIETELIEEDPPTLRITFQTPPHIELGDYRSVRIDPEEVSIEEAQVDMVLQEFRELSGMWVTSLGPAEYGDLVTMDIRGDLLDGTNLVDSEGVQGILAEPDEDDPIKAAANLVGMMVNQVKEYHLTFPEDFEPEHLAGRTALYKATILDLKKRELPEMTDKWAQGISPFDSLARLRQEVEAGLISEATDEAHEKLVRDYLHAVHEQSVVEIPPRMVDERIERVVNRLEFELKREGISLEDHLEALGMADLDALWEDMRPRATEVVIEDTILFTIAREDGISVSDEEVEAEIERAIEKYGEHADEARDLLAAKSDDIRVRLLTRKAVDHVIRLAKGDLPEEEPSPEAQVADDETDTTRSTEPVAETLDMAKEEEETS